MMSSPWRYSLAGSPLVMSQPAHHANASRNLFQNPWQTTNEVDDNAFDSELESQNSTWLGTLASGLPSLSSWLPSIPLEWAQDLSIHGIPPTDVVRPDFIKTVENGSENKLRATWLGHAVSINTVALILHLRRDVNFG